MVLLLLSVLAIGCVLGLPASSAPPLVSDRGLPSTPEDLIRAQGLPVETHLVITEDGYTLQLQRIPRPGSPAVFLMHGLVDSAGTWLVNLRNQSLAYILYDEGYDVWLGNQRGNRFSHAAQTAPMNWMFSIDQMAKYDDPAVLNYIITKTAHTSISWIGHSRGTQQMFYGLSAYQDGRASLINVFIALGPVAYVAHTKTMLLSQLARIDYDDLLDKMGLHDFLPSIGDVGLLCVVCKACCEDIVGAIVGPGQKNATLFNESRYDIYTKFAPAGTSSMEMAHYAQLVKTGLAVMYDYGTAGNQQHYGTPKPPAYNISSIPHTVPIALVSGALDYLADPTDVATLKAELGRRVVRSAIIEDFNHMAFTWGTSAHEQVYRPIILPLLRKYNTH